MLDYRYWESGFTQEREDLMLTKIFMLSLSNTRGKPETIVTLECEGFYSRPPNTPVHYRENDDDHQCKRCGGEADIWLDDPDKWEEHRDRCC